MKVANAAFRSVGRSVDLRRLSPTQRNAHTHRLAQPHGFDSAAVAACIFPRFCFKSPLFFSCPYLNIIQTDGCPASNLTAPGDGIHVVFISVDIIAAL